MQPSDHQKHVHPQGMADHTTCGSCGDLRAPPTALSAASAPYRVDVYKLKSLMLRASLPGGANARPRSLAMCSSVMK